MNVCLGTHIRLYSEFCKTVIHLLEFFPPVCSMGGVILPCCAHACIGRHSSKIWLSRSHRLDNTQGTIERPRGGWGMECDAQSRELNLSNTPQNLSYSLGMSKTNNTIKNYECVPWYSHTTLQ